MKSFKEIHGKLGFGSLRMPLNADKKVDIAVLCEMVDSYLACGFNYFDVAHAYMGGACEESIKKSLVERYPRDDFVLTDKLTYTFFNSKEDIRPFFKSQLDACGVEYFDFYLMHALTRKRYEKFEKCEAFKVISELKCEGKIRHIGISFHDKADFLEEVLNKHPEIEVVQIQFNYADYDSPSIESRKVYEVCQKYGKPVFVMEPVKGGGLQNLPAEAKMVFDEVNNTNGTSYSYAGFALRFAAGFEQMEVVLSGMSNMAQLKDNICTMQDFEPLKENELEAIHKVQKIFDSQQMIQCTACRYCVDRCPKHILIPDVFSCLNQKMVFNNWNQGYYYNNVLTVNNGKASDCLKCGRCEEECPQKLPIRQLLVKVADEFELKINDMDRSDESYKYAMWALNKYHTFLDKNGNFNPAGITRKIDLIVFIWRMSGRPAYVAEQKIDISDVTSDNKFYDAIMWGVSKKIFYLDGAKKINLGKLCTRLDLIAYLWRLKGCITVKHNDLKVEDYKEGQFYEAICWAIKNKIVQLDENFKVYPYERLDRITAFEFLYNYSVIV